MNNTFLMLCQKYDPKKIGLAGNLISEKLDGQRAFWDGRVTAGMAVRDVPWAAHHDARKQEMISTGLWSRLGNPVHAPKSWLAKLPDGILLDGELFSGYEHRQYLMSTIKKEDGSTDWCKVQYVIYDTPPARCFFSGREVTFKPGTKQILSGMIDYAGRVTSVGFGTTFGSRYEWLKAHGFWNDTVRLLEQHEIPYGSGSKDFVDGLLLKVLDARGEGLVLKPRDGRYECCRSWNSVKMKPFEDMEGTVIGFVAGKETDKGSRLLGKMGSLTVRIANGRTLNLSGFDDSERMLGAGTSIIAITKQGEHFAEGTPIFPLGTVVSFKYRGLTADGIPMEARFWRQRSDE